MKAILAVVRRDLLLAVRRKSEVLTVLFFFMIVVSLFPLGIGPETPLLRKIAPGILWVAALLASMLGLARLFAADHADGTLEQLALSPSPLGLLVTGKIAAHWLVSGLPLVLLAPVLGIQFDLDAGALGVLWVLGWAIVQPWFYAGLGVQTPSLAAALLLFMLAMPVFLYFAQPLTRLFSRRNEFEADAFATRHANAEDLVHALVKLYRDNASTLTPDPIHSAFYDSHPPAATRISRLRTA